VDEVPHCVEVWNFVGKEFKNVETDGEAENDGVGEDVEFFREMDHMETFEKAKRGDGSVEVESGGETGAESERDGLKRVHVKRRIE
jgi:hypothetical protein